MSYPSEMRATVMSSLEQARSEFGCVPSWVVAQLSEKLPPGRSTIWKWLSEETADDAGPVLEKLEDEHIEVVFKHMGNLAKAKRELDRRYPDVFKGMSYDTFRRRWLDVDIGVREMARGGASALMRVQPKMLHQEDAPNDVWHIDHQELPIWVFPRGHRKNPVKPWFTTVQDDRTRRIMSGLLTFQHPNTESTMVALADGMLIRPLSVKDRFVGGVPAAIHSDNGSDFRSHQYTQFLTRLQIAQKLTYPRQKHQNGKVERVQRTMQEDLIAELPGFADGPETLKLKDLFGLDGPLMDEDTLWELLLDWMERYNSERPHSSLDGQTPNQVWAELNPPLREIDGETLRLAMLAAAKPRKVQPTGVHFEGQYYISPELAAAKLVGAEVDVRYMPNNLSFIEVYYDDEWVATAYPHASLTDEQRAVIDEGRREEYSGVRAYHAAAAERRSLEADIDPEALIHVDRTQPAPTAGQLEGDDDALFGLSAPDGPDPAQTEEDGS